MVIKISRASVIAASKIELANYIKNRIASFDKIAATNADFRRLIGVL